MGVIYLLTFDDGRRYVGQTRDLAKRLRRHAKAAAHGVDVPVSLAWAAMGAPICTVLRTVPDAEMDRCERAAIEEHRTLWPDGLNRNSGGKRGSRACEETRALKSRANTQRYADPAERERSRQQTTARFQDPAERKRASEQQTLRYQDATARAKTSMAMKAVAARPEEMARKSVASRELWADPEYRLRMRDIKAATLPKGSKCPWAKLTEADVKAIRAERSAGVSLAELATRYGISEASVCGIAKRRTWTHVA
jgi:hypothetical protein